MGFRITRRTDRDGNTGLKVEGRLLGPEAARLLAEQIALAAAESPATVVDLSDVSAYDAACLEVLVARPENATLAGVAAHLAALLAR